MPDPTPTPSPQPHDELAAARTEIERLKTEHARETVRRAIEQSVADSIDPETARLLMERAIESAPDKTAAIPGASKALRAAKPFLFAPRSGASASSSAAAPPADEAARAARQGRESGDRKDLLRYLRLRAGG